MPSAFVQNTWRIAPRASTVCDLHQATIAHGSIVNNDPNLRQEHSITSELSAIRKTDHSDVCATVSNEFTSEALYPQTDVTTRKWQPRYLLATWRADDHWSNTGCVRHSSQQYNTLDNSDTYSHVHTGTGPFLGVDLKLNYHRDAH